MRNANLGKGSFPLCPSTVDNVPLLRCNHNILYVVVTLVELWTFFESVVKSVATFSDRTRILHKAMNARRPESRDGIPPNYGTVSETSGTLVTRPGGPQPDRARRAATFQIQTILRIRPPHFLPFALLCFPSVLRHNINTKSDCFLGHRPRIRVKGTALPIVERDSWQCQYQIQSERDK